MKHHYTVTVEEKDDGSRLDSWLSKRYNELNFNTVNIMCRKGIFRVNGTRIKSSYRLKSGDFIKIPSLLLKKENNDFDNQELSKNIAKKVIDSVIFKDNFLLALNKPAGIATQGGTNQGNNHIDAYRSVLKFDLEESPKLVHRLDKDTSGVILLARDSKTAQKITQKFKEKEIKKFYWALVQGGPKKNLGSIEGYIGEDEIWRPKKSDSKDSYTINDDRKEKSKKFALTHYKVIERMGSKYSWLLLSPSTGRTHQLRIHTASLGTPIIGDRKYMKKDNEHSVGYPEEFGRLYLHARSILFDHPRTGKPVDLKAKLPEHMLKVWRFFGWNPDHTDYF